MTDRIPLEQAIAYLPTFSGEISETSRNHAGFSLTVEFDDSYIWPDVVVDQTTTDNHVVLITAPGAGGKSAASRAIASRLNASLIDLACLQVGSNTLIGLLADALGWEKAPSFVSELRNGNRTLVLDSLDEARILAGRDNFVAFLRDFSSIMKDAPLQGQVVILGRRESIEDAFLILDEVEVSSTIMKIQPLSYDQSSSLISKALDKKNTDSGPYRVHRVHEKPFKDFRDKVFLDIAEALGASSESPQKYWPDVETFLGYPPVLLALAERLAVDNPKNQTHVTMQANADNKAERGTLLRQITEGILDREQEKVQGQLARTLNITPEACGVLYGREEQSLRVLRAAQRADFVVVSPAVLSTQDRVIYEEQIESFVLDHPFLAGNKFSNVVFADYLRSFVATSSTIEVNGVGKNQLLSMCEKVGPFFAHFMFDLSRDSNTTEGGTESAERPARIEDESLVSNLIESHYLGALGEAFVTYVEDSTPHQAWLALTDTSDELSQTSGYSITFHITSPTGILELSTPLRNCIIASKHAVILSPESDVIEFSKVVIVICKELELEGTEALISGGDQDGANVTLIASDQCSHDAKLKVSTFPKNALSIHWPNVWHQWRSHVAKLPDMGNFISAHDAFQVLFWIRRILTSMKSGMGDSPSVYCELLDKLIIGSNPVAKATLKALIELAIIFEHGAVYRIDLDRLKKYGVNYAALRGNNFKENLEGLHAEACRTKSVLDVVSKPA